MAAILSSGVKSLILTLTTPYDTIRTTDIRDDLVKVVVWCSTVSGFTPSDSNKVFDGLSLSITIPDLIVGTPYYVKYAFISSIDQNTFTISSQLSATPVEATPGSSVTMIFKRSPLQPATPNPSPSTPAGWYADVNSVPVGTDPIWTSVGSKPGTSNDFTWQSPIRIEGEGGVKGDSFRIAYKTQPQQNAAPVINPNTTSGSTSFPAGWGGIIDAPGPGESLWASDGIYNTPTDTTTWGTPYLTQGFPNTIQSDNYNAIDAGWQIQRDTGNAFFNNITARGSLVTGSVGAQRIEINKTTLSGAPSNRLEAFTSNNIRFLSLGGSGGTTADTAVIGISANSNVTNPVWVESSANVGSNILSNTLSGANALSSVSTGGGRLFYGYVTGTSNPANAFQIDINSINHTGNAIKINTGTSTGSAISIGGTGDGYAIDAVSNTSGPENSKSGIGFFRGIDFPTYESRVTSPGTSAKLEISFTNLDTAGELLYSFVIENTAYSFPLEYDSETFNTLELFVIAIAASINNVWQVSSTGTLASGKFILTRPSVGVISSTNSASVGSFVGVFTNGTNTEYNKTPVIVRLKPFTNLATDVLRGDGTWGTVSSSGGYIDRRYNVRDYKAVGNGSTDDTAAIQSAIDAAVATGGTVYFPRGVYIISSSLTYSAPAGLDPSYRVHFAGDGIGASVIRQIGTGNGLTITGYAGTPVNPNLYSHICDLSFLGSGSGQGLSISNSAYVYVEACWFGNWAYGFYGSNFLSSTFTSCSFRFNTRGFLVERIAGGNYASNPNAITMVNCEIGANSLFGGWILGAGVFTMQGGAIEANGTTTGSSSNWGIRISEPSGATATESAVGVSLDGVYFEANIGIADLWISSSSPKPGVTNNISGCSFLRVSTTSYVTNNILLDASSANAFNNFINACGFKGLGGYVPDSSRKTIISSSNKVNLVGCSFDNSIDAYVNGDANVFENGVRVSSITNLEGASFAYTSNPLASGTANAGTLDLFARGDHVHPFSVNTVAASGSGSITYNSTSGVLTYTPPAGLGNVNAGTQYQLAYYSSNGSTVSGSNLLTVDSSDSNLYLNKPGVTDLRLSYALPGISAPGISSTGANLAIASGFNNSTGSFTAGLLISNQFNSSASFSGGVSGTTAGTPSMNLGTSSSPWKTFYWGLNSTGIPAPSGSTTTFLRNDGTWATPAAVTSVGGTGSGLGFSLSGTVTSTGSITLSTPTAAQLQTSLGLGALAYVSSLTTFQELNSTALAANVSSSGNRILATENGSRTWATMSQVRTALGDGGGTPSSSTYLRGDGVWATPATGGTGTVTSVSGTGSVSGLTLSGTVTTSGSLTLSGSLSLTSSQVTSALGYTPISSIPDYYITTLFGNSGYGIGSGTSMNIVTGTGLVGTYNFTGSGNTLTLASVSDKRLKENIADEMLGLDFVMKLRPVTFNRIDLPHTTKFHGFLADDIQEIITDTNDSLNQTHEDGTKSLDYIGLISILTKSIQELNQKVESLEAQLKG